jgi:hypothetical protein
MFAGHAIKRYQFCVPDFREVNGGLQPPPLNSRRYKDVVDLKRVAFRATGPSLSRALARPFGVGFLFHLSGVSWRFNTDIQLLATAQSFSLEQQMNKRDEKNGNGENEQSINHRRPAAEPIAPAGGDGKG